MSGPNPLFRHGSIFRAEPDISRNVHGSARWMTSEDAKALGLDDPAGVVLGQRKNGDLIRFNGDGHLMVFAPTGAGKGIGFVQPNLVHYKGSLVCLDPKGENCIRSAKYRRDVLKQKVVVLDPFKMTDEPTSDYNPLGMLTYADGEVLGPVIQYIADALIPAKSEREQHWNEGAKTFLAFLMWWMVAHEAPDNRNLVRLYELAHGGFDLLSKIAGVMVEGRSTDPDIARVCRAMGNWFEGREHREFSYFESIACNHVKWIGDSVWSSVLAGPPSPPMPLKTIERGMTVYLVLPFHRLERYQGWLRLMVADLLGTLYETQGAPKVPVLFLLDEAAAGLGRMSMLYDAMATVRSAGARLCFVYQNVAQVQQLYGEAWQNFISNSGATLFWSVNDTPAAQFISMRCGQKTSRVPGNPVGMAEPLMRVEELSTLPADEIIGLFRNSYPAQFGRLDYRNDPRLAPNKTYGEPVAKTYKPRNDFVPVDLNALSTKKRQDDPADDEPEDAPQVPSRKNALSGIAETTGIPLAALQELEKQFGSLVLRGRDLGYLNDRGMFETIASGNSDGA